MLRTLGIPARPITNFESAHDGDGNRALDRYWNLKDELDEDKSHDSIWYIQSYPKLLAIYFIGILENVLFCRNYHVWVEAWMSRPDLGPEYNGWQAVDATPQVTHLIIMIYVPPEVMESIFGTRVALFQRDLVFILQRSNDTQSKMYIGIIVSLIERNCPYNYLRSLKLERLKGSTIINTSL